MCPQGYRNGGGKWRSGGEKGAFGEADRGQDKLVPVDVGHGNMVEAKVGADFVNTVEQIARDCHYGGFYRVYLAQNGGKMSEVLNPSDAPAKIESGMRLAITSYDKVG